MFFLKNFILESWFYMIAEWFIGYDKLPWQKSPVEYLELKEKLRDDNSKCFKDFFGEYEKLPVEFVKILRYIDSLKRDDEPDYNRIIDFLKQAYQVCLIYYFICLLNVKG